MSHSSRRARLSLRSPTPSEGSRKRTHLVAEPSESVAAPPQGDPETSSHPSSASLGELLLVPEKRFSMGLVANCADTATSNSPRGELSTAARRPHALDVLAGADQSCGLQPRRPGCIPVPQLICPRNRTTEPTPVTLHDQRHTDPTRAQPSRARDQHDPARHSFRHPVSLPARPAADSPGPRRAGAGQPRPRPPAGADDLAPPDPNKPFFVRESELLLISARAYVAIPLTTEPSHSRGSLELLLGTPTRPAAYSPGPRRPHDGVDDPARNTPHRYALTGAFSMTL